MKQVNILGMPLDEWEHKSCIAHCGVGEDWATIYDIESKEKGKGHASELIIKMKQYYEAQNKKFGGTVALNPTMSHIYKKLGILEFK